MEHITGLEMMDTGMRLRLKRKELQEMMEEIALQAETVRPVVEIVPVDVVMVQRSLYTVIITIK